MYGRGLKNLGATSYLSAILHVLAEIPELANSIMDCAAREVQEQRYDKTPNVLIALASIIERLRSPIEGSEGEDVDAPGGRQTAVSPKPLCDAFGWGIADLMRPEDVGEVLPMILNHIIKKHKDVAAPIQGLLVNVIEGMVPADCPHKYMRQEEFITVTLQMPPRRIQDMLDRLCCRDALRGDNKYFCDSCEGKRDSWKGVQLHTLPPVLLLSPRRNQFNFNTFQTEKVYDHVHIPPTLDVKPWLVKEKAEEQDEKLCLYRTSLGVVVDAFVGMPMMQSLREMVIDYICTDVSIYTLTGVVAHKGSATVGFYQAYFRQEEIGPSTRGNQGKWRMYCDENVTELDDQAMTELGFLGGKEERPDLGRVDQPSSYMLVYRRLDGPLRALCEGA